MGYYPVAEVVISNHLAPHELLIQYLIKSTMDKLQKFELMNKIVRELEDLQNSQTALIKKIGKIEVDNMNGLNDKFLEKNLGEMHSKIAENVDAVTNIFTHFEEQRDNYAEKNKSAIEALEAQAAIEAADE